MPSRRSRVPAPEDTSRLERFKRAIEPPVPFLNPDLAVPPTLYHYTIASAFVGILGCRHLRATNFAYLNDTTEVNHGKWLVAQAIRLRTRRRSPKTTARFLAKLSKYFNHQTPSGLYDPASEVYVCSFSALRNDLSQWRSYGTMAAERYAIGFDSAALQQLTSLALSLAGGHSVSFERIAYDEREQLRQIEHVLNGATTAIADMQIEDPIVDSFASATAQRLALLLPTFKHAAFERESEWRIIMREEPDACKKDPEACVQFDTSRGVVRPFLKFALPSPPPITEVLFLAPTRSAAARKAAKIALVQAGVRDVEPEPSKLPFAE